MHSITPEEFNNMIDNYENSKRTRIEDSYFAIVALNLSGKSDQLQDEAMRLIDKYGIKKR